MGDGWGECLTTGVMAIDEGNRELMLRVEQVIDACGEAGRPGAVVECMDTLSGFMIRHFSEEERLMKQRGYPGMKEHKMQHTAFLVELLGLMDTLDREGASQSFVGAARALLVDLLTDHVFMYDWDVGRYMRMDRAA